MKKKTKKKDEIYDYIKKYVTVRPVSILSAVSISETNLYKNLNKLINEDLIIKKGNGGAMYYSIKDINDNKFLNLKGNNIDEYSEYIINKNYIYVSPSGEMIKGWDGFYNWCVRYKLNIEIETKNYIKLIKDINKVKKNGLISAKKNILSQGKEAIGLYIDKLYYSDFYNIGHFGKTKLGQLLYIAKSSQNRKLIKEIANIIAHDIHNILLMHNIKYIGYIPPTINRNTQFIKELELELDKLLNLKLEYKKIKIEKIKSETLVAQKTLKKLSDRVYNAKHTILVDPRQKIDDNVLIIDDATGSGATLNETASKIKNISDKNFKIIAYSVVGSMKGYDVINEI